MIRFLIAIPALLSFVMLAAHFLRDLQYGMVGACMLLPLLLIPRRGWTVLVVQLVLLAGAGLWLWTMWEIAEIRATMGKPSMRMTIILTSVAAWNLLSALLLELPMFRRSSRAKGFEVTSCDNSGTAGSPGSALQ